MVFFNVKLADISWNCTEKLQLQYNLQKNVFYPMCERWKIPKVLENITFVIG